MQKRNQPTALVDNTAKFKMTKLQKSLTALTLVAGMGGVVAAPTLAVASSTNNPYVTGGISTGTTTTSTSGGVSSNNAYANATQGTTGATANNATGATSTYSSSIPNAADDAAIDAQTDAEVSGELQACAATMNDLINQNQKDEVGVVVAGADASDKIFNASTDLGDGVNEATKGCFTAGEEIINLATLIPSVQTSWRGTIGNVIKDQLQKRALQLKNSILKRGCKIANDAVLKALEPVQEYMQTANKMSAVINNPEDFLGEYLASKIDVEFDRTDLAFNQTLDTIKSKVDGDVAEATSKLGNANTAYSYLISEDPAAQAAMDAAIAQQNQQNAAAVQAAQAGAAATPTNTTGANTTGTNAPGTANTAIGWLNSLGNKLTGNTPTTTTTPTTTYSANTTTAPQSTTTTTAAPATKSTGSSSGNLYNFEGTTSNSPSNMYAQ